MESQSRRKFLQVVLAASATLGGGVLLYPVIRYLAPRSSSKSQNAVEITLNQVADGEAKFFDYEGKAAVLVKLAGGNVIVHSAVCTHLGCIVQWQKAEGQFLCPCHAGRYTADGRVLSGPPPKPLESLPFVISNGVVRVG